jgi:hypothetical protein
MKIPESLIPLLCILPFSPITWVCLGWVALSIVVGVRGGWNAGVRLFLLGLGLLGIVLIFGIAVYFLPDWLAASMLILLAILPWLSILVYLVMQRFNGKALLTLQNDEKWSMSIMSGAFSIILGLTQFISAGHPTFFSSAKFYALGIVLVSFGLSRMLKKIRRTEVREKGILYENGNFYQWDNIENYRWKFAEDKLSLKLRESIWKRNVSLKIRSQFRQEIVAYLAQNVNNKAENSQTVPLQTKNAG